jgi:hypothetical protein
MLRTLAPSSRWVAPTLGPLGPLCCGGGRSARTVSIRRPVLFADPIGWHSTQPFQPGATSSSPNPSLAPVPDFAHIWLVRWISAAGLLRFWCSVRDVVAHQSHHQPLAATVSIRTSTTRLEPHWGIGSQCRPDVLTFCASRNGDLPDALVHAGTLL